MAYKAVHVYFSHFTYIPNMPERGVSGDFPKPNDSLPVTSLAQFGMNSIIINFDDENPCRFQRLTMCS